MDTREKILPFDAVHPLLTSGDWTVITGLFDPLTLAQAQRLAAAAVTGGKVLVVVVEDSATLLPAQARAALIAGLRLVDAVTMADLGQAKQLCSLTNEHLGFERERSAEFVRFVVKRQRSAVVSNGSQK